MDFILAVISWAQEHKTALLSLVGGGAGLSILLETTLHKFRVDSKKTAYTLLHLFSIITVLLGAVAGSIPSMDTLPVYAALVIVAQTWHRFVVSDAYTKYIKPYLDFLANQKTPPIPGTTASTTPSASMVAPAQPPVEESKPFTLK